MRKKNRRREHFPSAKNNILSSSIRQSAQRIRRSAKLDSADTIRDTL